MTMLCIFLVWFNNLDVLPELAFIFEMSFLKEPGLHLSSFHTEELYNLFKDNHGGWTQIKIQDPGVPVWRSGHTPAKSHRLRCDYLVLIGFESTYAGQAVHHLEPWGRSTGIAQVYVCDQDVGEHMQTFAKEHVMSMPRRTLKILLSGGRFMVKPHASHHSAQLSPGSRC